MSQTRRVEVTTCEPHGTALIPVVLFRNSVKRWFTSGDDEQRQSFTRGIEALEASNKVCRTMLLGCDNHGGDWWSVVKREHCWHYQTVRRLLCCEECRSGTGDRVLGRGILRCFLLLGVCISSVAVKLLVGIEPSPLNWPLVRLKTTKSVESAEYQADLQNERHHCMYPVRSSDGPQSLQAGC